MDTTLEHLPEQKQLREITAPTAEQLEEIKDKVYRQYPLPLNVPFNSNNNLNISPNFRNQVNATGVGIGIGAYIVYKVIEAGASWECLGCAAWLTP